MNYLLTLSAHEYTFDRWVPVGEYDTLKIEGVDNVMYEPHRLFGEGQYDVSACLSSPNTPCIPYFDW